MDRLRAALDEVIEKVKVAIQGESKSPIEVLLDQHLPLYNDVVPFSPKNCCAVAIPTYAMNDFVSRTHNIVDYPFIMGRIWDILLDAQHDPNLMKKALNLLHYLLINGSIQVLKDCQDSVRLHFFDELASDYNRVEFDQYKFSKHLDIGAGVRKTASEICHLAAQERELFHARLTAQKLHQSLSVRGLRSACPLPKGEEHTADSTTSCSSNSLSFRDERWPPKYTNSLPTGPMWEDDLASKIVTHSESAPDDAKDESPHGSRHSSGSSQTSSTSSTNSRSTSSSRVNRREISSLRQESSFTTTNVDLLGLDAFLPPTETATTTRPQHGAPNEPSSRTRSRQKLVATI